DAASSRPTTPTLFPYTTLFRSDNGFLSLVTVPEVRTVTDLKGRTVSVDARTTGYAFVLFDLLKRKGLNDADYKVEKAGDVLQRRSEEHTSELQSRFDLVCRLLL